MKLTAEEQAWLKKWDMVDDDIDLDQVELHIGGAMGAYLKATKHGAITTGNNIWFRDEGRRTDIDLIVHELVHVGQYKRRGRFGFLRSYLTDIARHRGYTRNHPLEAPAYERQRKARQIVKANGGPAPLNA